MVSKTIAVVGTWSQTSSLEAWECLGYRVIAKQTIGFV